MKKFTFTNISNDLTAEDVASVLSTKSKSISPELKLKPISFLEPYYRDNIPQTSNVDGVLIRLPIYGNRFITLAPKESIEIETENALEVEFYENVINSFNEDANYPILECKEEDEPSPTTDFQLIREDGTPIYDGDIEIGREYTITQTLSIGDNYKATLSIENAEPIVENVTIQDFSSLTSVEGSYGFSMWDGKFGVVFNATTENGSDWVSKPGYVFAFGGGDWIKILLEPTTPTGYTIPFEISASLFEDTDIGGATGPVISANPAINNLIVGTNYKFTLYDKNNMGYSITGTAIEDEGMVMVGFDYETENLPEAIQALFGIQHTAVFSLINNFSFTQGTGDYFTLYSQVEEGKLSADIQAVIDKFYIEEA